MLPQMKIKICYVSKFKSELLEEINNLFKISIFINY
jgi:hypothetical protein